MARKTDITLITTRLLTIMTALIMAMNTPAQKLFTLEDLNFGGHNYHSFRPKNMFLSWWGDRLVQNDVEQCSLVDVKTGKKTVLFTLDDINQWAQSDDTYRVRHLLGASFPYPDEPLVMVGNRKSVLLIDFKKKQTVWQDSVSGQTANDFCPASRATAWVSDDQLFVADGSGNKHQLTTDGSRDIVYGQAVHRNEFGIDKGTFWSPDGQRLAFYRMDQSMVTDYPQVNTDARSAELEPDKYPMAGMTTHRVTVGVYDLRTDRTVYLDTPAADEQGEPPYLTNITFSPDSRLVFLFELNRDQNDCRLRCYDAATGRFCYELDRETSDKYVEPLHPIEFLPWDDNLFIMQSQRDGYNHLYLYSIKGEHIKQLTSGQWVVMQVLGFDRKHKAVIIASNERNPLQRNIYAVDAWTGERTLLDNGEGWHQAVLSHSGVALYDRWQTPTTANTVDVVRLPSQRKSPLTVNLLQAPDPWQGYQQPGFFSGTIKAADGVTDLYWRMVVPTELSEELKADSSSSAPDSSFLIPDSSFLILHSSFTKKYPTVVYVYGGPHAHNVDSRWHWASRSWETYMAQKGYVVFILDNRGSENRGRDFEQATFRQLGQVEMQDQMKGVEFLRTLPFVDQSRMGLHGWSFGGFMTISLMLNHPDVFRVAVAGGPVIDWKWYEVMYGERYMDTPDSNPEGYALTSLVDKAANLRGKLQIIIGGNDPTVVPQHTMAFLKACVEAGTQPDLFVYPGEGHNMMGHSSVHLHERITQYFEDYLK